MRKLLPCIAVFCSTCGIDAAIAEDTVPLELERITVVAHKMPRPVRDVAGIVSVFDRRDIEQHVVEDIEDLVRYEPTVSVNREATRFGLGGFIIRGVGGNRVAVELDGVPQSDGFAIGDFSNAGRDFVDPEMIGRVEILRGPASSLYGSDALGGVVTFTTRDPAEYLDRGRDVGAVLRGGFTSDDDAWATTAGAAFRAGDLDALFIGSRREGTALDAKGADPNPTGRDETSALAKLVHYGDGGNATRLVLDANDANRTTHVRSLVGAPGRFANTTALSGDDGHRRERVSLEHELAGLGNLAESGVARLFWQRSETEQRTTEDRAPDSRTPHSTRRVREFFFQQVITGGELTLERPAVAWGLEHRFVYGAELVLAETEELRDAVLINRSDGSRTNVILGEVFPLRDFPVTDTLEAGLYAHDEIALGDNWTLIPALRVEHYELDPEPDAIYREDFPDTPVTGLSETSFSPKLALLRRVGRHGSAYAQYSRGFRAPPFEDVNIGLEIPLFNIRAIPNPDLEAESSDGLEIGYRHQAGTFALEAALFYTDFDNLIESKVNLGPDPESGFLLFQSQNRDEARIYGGEVGGRWELSTLHPRLRGWSARAAVGVTRGDDTARELPLNSVEPDRAVVGIAYRSPGDRWRVEAVGTFSADKSRVDESSVDLFTPSGYGVLDVLGHYRITEAVRLNWGVFNVFDRRYWQWSDVQGLPAGDPAIPLFARPGRGASVSVRIRF